jgi:hypothetical protein
MRNKMKKSLIPILLIFAVLFESCTGPAGNDGLEGLPGPAGKDGVNVVGTTFDVTNVNFTAANEYSASFTFPANKVEVFESDAVLVYREWAKQSDPSGPISVWRLLPQTVLLNGNLLQYNFDHTFTEAFFYLDGNVNKPGLASSWTQNQTFRVVIIPSDYTSRKNADLDYNDYESVKKHLGIDESKIVTYQAK